MNTSRRALLASVPAFAVIPIIVGCSGSSATVTLATAQAYFDAGAAAVMAAAQTYILTPVTAAAVPVVTTLLADLANLKTTVDGITVAATWQAAATEALAALQQLSPIVAPFLGAAATYVPLAIAVVTAFINSLPMPANAPATPPAALVSKAMEYRAH